MRLPSVSEPIATRIDIYLYVFGTDTNNNSNGEKVAWPTAASNSTAASSRLLEAERILVGEVDPPGPEGRAIPIRVGQRDASMGRIGV